MNINAYCLGEQLTSRGNEADQGAPGSVTSETGWKSIMLQQLESHKIVISGCP